MAPSVITFGALIKLYTRKGKMAEAMQVVAEMQSLGIEHSKQTYSMLISGHSAVGDVEAAYATFQAMARSRCVIFSIWQDIVLSSFSWCFLLSVFLPCVCVFLLLCFCVCALVLSFFFVSFSRLLSNTIMSSHDHVLEA